MLFEILKAVLYGVVEGITEWLPVSSTAHLMLLGRFLPFQNVSEGFPGVFEVVIQLGAILAVVITLWKHIWPFGRDREGRIYARGKVWMTWFKVVVACLPLPVILALDLDELIAGDNLLAIALALIVVGALFFLVENLREGRKPSVRKVSEITFPMAFAIGLGQAVAAVFPGTSRSGATIIVALLMGISRGAAVEFTFTMAIPVMLGASAMDLLKAGFAFSGAELALLAAGVVTAFAVSMLVIRPLLSFIRRHTFRGFGGYRILLGVAILAWLWLGQG